MANYLAFLPFELLYLWKVGISRCFEKNSKFCKKMLAFSRKVWYHIKAPVMGA